MADLVRHDVASIRLDVTSICPDIASIRLDVIL